KIRLQHIAHTAVRNSAVIFDRTGRDDRVNLLWRLCRDCIRKINEHTLTLTVPRVDKREKKRGNLRPTSVRLAAWGNLHAVLEPEAIVKLLLVARTLTPSLASRRS